jgi:hypothetical protein
MIVNLRSIPLPRIPMRAARRQLTARCCCVQKRSRRVFLSTLLGKVIAILRPVEEMSHHLYGYLE